MTTEDSTQHNLPDEQDARASTDEGADHGVDSADDGAEENRKAWMRIDILSAVPESIRPVVESSIVGRAGRGGVVDIHVHSLRDYGLKKYRQIDDTPFGGGAGMILRCEPVFACVEALQAERDYDDIIFMTPDGDLLDQPLCNTLSMQRNLIILAGHYKGIDQRIRDVLVTREISIGNYVLTGGELPALILADAIVRLLPGALGDAESALSDSFQSDVLDCPHYTKPAEFRGHRVPDVLQSGDHAAIERWRDEQSLEKTRLRRPEMLTAEQLEPARKPKKPRFTNSGNTGS